MSSHSQGYFAGGCLVNPPSSSVKKEGQKSGSSFFPPILHIVAKQCWLKRKEFPTKHTKPNLTTTSQKMFGFGEMSQNQNEEKLDSGQLGPKSANE